MFLIEVAVLTKNSELATMNTMLEMLIKVCISIIRKRTRKRNEAFYQFIEFVTKAIALIMILSY